MIGNFAEAALVIVFAAAVGYQFDAIAAAQQFVSQRFGRINMAAGAAGRENNQGFSSFFAFLVADIFVLRMNILRVMAKSMPIPRAVASNDDPP